MADEVAEQVETTTETTTAEAPPISLLTDPPPSGEVTPETKAEAQTETTDAKAEGDEAKTEAPQGAPEKYEFTVPEGMVLDEAALGKFEPVARELNLNQEQANKLVGLYTEQMQALAATQEQAQSAFEAARDKEWISAIKADPDFIGDKFQANLGLAQSFVARVEALSPGFIAALNQTRNGNNPAFIKAFTALGKATAEGDWGAGKTNNEAPKDVAHQMYPYMK